MVRSTVLLVGLAGLVGACELGAEGNGLTIRLGREANEPFEWSGPLAPGQRLEIKGVKGSITARAGAEAAVSASRRGLRSDPDAVRIEVVEHPAGVTICAVYPGDNVCAPGEQGRIRATNNDVTVDFDIALPDEIDLAARTVNGAVTAQALGGNVEGHSVNGSVSISTAGHARATTVNGSIEAIVGAADWTDELVFESVNGGVELRLPSDTATDVSLRTTNGGIRSDLPVTITRSSRRRLEGTIGAGGRLLTVNTVNGSIRLLVNE